MAKKSTSCNCSNDSSNSRYTIFDNNEYDFVAEDILFEQIADHISEYMGDNDIHEDDADFLVFRNVDVNIEIISNPKVTVTLK